MKVSTIKKSRVESTCYRCRRTIRKGEKRYFITPRVGPTRNFCEQHYPRTSEMVASEKLQRAYRAQEDLVDLNLTPLEVSSGPSDMWTAVEDIIETLEGLMEEAREVAEEYDESYSNMEQYFPNGNPPMQDCQDKSETLNQWADEIEAAMGDLNQTCENIGEWASSNPQPNSDDGDAVSQWALEFEEFLSECVVEISDALDTISSLEL